MCFSARMAFAALLLGSTIAAFAMAQGTASVGCPPGCSKAVRVMATCASLTQNIARE